MHLILILSIILEVVIGTAFLGNNKIPKQVQAVLCGVAFSCLLFQLIYIFF
jgi:hypothetical protein